MISGHCVHRRTLEVRTCVSKSRWHQPSALSFFVRAALLFVLALCYGCICNGSRRATSPYYPHRPCAIGCRLCWHMLAWAILVVAISAPGSAGSIVLSHLCPGAQPTSASPSRCCDDHTHGLSCMDGPPVILPASGFLCPGCAEFVIVGLPATTWIQPDPAAPKNTAVPSSSGPVSKMCHPHPRPSSSLARTLSRVPPPPPPPTRSTAPAAARSRSPRREAIAGPAGH